MDREAQKFKHVGGHRSPINRNLELFRNPLTGRVAKLSKNVLSAAALCKEFATLEVHGSRVNRLYGTQCESGLDWRSLLNEAVDSGALISEQELTDRICNSFEQLPRRRTIDAVAVPTRNRPAMLRRLLFSLSDQLRDFGYRKDVYVVDDSESGQMQEATLAVVKSFAENEHLRLRYSNRAMRKRFAEKVVSASGVPAQSVAFAMGANSAFPISTGSARNAITLDTLGNHVLLLDDDVQCRFASIPGAEKVVSFQGDAFCTWFFKSLREIHDYSFERFDIVAAHEAVLNVDRGSLDQTHPEAHRIDASEVSSRFLKAVGAGFRVAVSLTGIIGDSGWDDPLGYFLLGAETVSRLTETEDIYVAAMKNRLIMNGPRRICISDQCTCHSTCMAVDNSQLLPPFLPVMRGEDLVFGSLLAKCFPGALFGAIPAAVLHEPAEERSFASDAALLRAGTFMTGETLALLARIEPIRGSSSVDLMRSLGMHLQELRLLTDRDFRAHVKSAVEPMVILCLQQLEKVIESHSGASTRWLNDARTFSAATLRALRMRNYAAPTDLESAFGIEEGERRFRWLIEEFGKLLTVWPDLVSAVQRLHREGYAMCDSGNSHSDSGDLRVGCCTQM